MHALRVPSLPRATGLAAGLAVGLAVALVLGACPPRSGPDGPRRRAAGGAVDFSFQSLTGGTMKLSELRGKPLVVLFFTTWCVPCQVQAARLQPLRAALGNHRVSLLGVSLDTERHLVPTFVEAAGINFPVVYGDANMVRASALGPVRGVPRVLVLDRAGRPVADFHGPVEGKTLLKILKPLL